LAIEFDRALHVVDVNTNLKFHSSLPHAPPKFGGHSPRPDRTLSGFGRTATGLRSSATR
jgi:hypothetical protein